MIRVPKPEDLVDKQNGIYNDIKQEYTLEDALLCAVYEMSDEFRKEMLKKLDRVFTEFLLQIKIVRKDIANGTVELEDMLSRRNSRK